MGGRIRRAAMALPDGLAQVIKTPRRYAASSGVAHESLGEHRGVNAIVSYFEPRLRTGTVRDHHGTSRFPQYRPRIDHGYRSRERNMLPSLLRSTP